MDTRAINHDSNYRVVVHSRQPITPYINSKQKYYVSRGQNLRAGTVNLPQDSTFGLSPVRNRIIGECYDFWIGLNASNPERIYPGRHELRDFAFPLWVASELGSCYKNRDLVYVRSEIEYSENATIFGWF